MSKSEVQVSAGEAEPLRVPEHHFPLLRAAPSRPAPVLGGFLSSNQLQEGWICPGVWFFQLLRGQESFLACKYRALDPQGDRVFCISMDERSVRSHLVDFAQAVPSNWIVFPTLVSMSQKLFSKVLLK